MDVHPDPQATRPAPDTAHRPPPPDEPYYRRGEHARRWGGILVLIGVVWLVFAIGSRVPLFGAGFTERTAALDPQLFSAERVVVSGVADEIELVGWNRDEVQVEVTKHAFGWGQAAAQEALDELEVLLIPQGETLTIEVRRPLGTMIGRAPYARLRIALPPDTAAEARLVSGDIQAAEVRGDLTLSTVSGSLDVADTSGSLTVSITSGDLVVRDHAGPLIAESVSGDVRLAGDLLNPAVKTVSGDARVEGAAGRAELSSISGSLSVAGAGLEALAIESTSGDVRAALGLADGATARISNISGDVEVELYAPTDLELAATTASGEITTDIPGLDEERRSLRGTLGEGEASLTISTTSGDIEVQRDQ